MPDLTATMRPRNPAAHLKPHHFPKGVSGNPGGRPQGARNRLNSLALNYLLKDFEQHGETVIERVREKKPEVYLAAVVALLPKQKEQIHQPFADLTDEELENLERYLKASRAKNVTPEITS